MIHNRMALSLVVMLATMLNISAQEVKPCFETTSSTELRELGTGKGESAFEALTAAMNNAMRKIKADVEEQFPNKKFDYSVLSKSTSDGEEIELETTLGQPSVCQQEIECQENSTKCTATIVLSFDIAEWLKDNAQ